MNGIRILGGMVAAVATTLALTGPAGAQTRTATDPRVDARPYVDIVRATFTNTGDLVTARVRVRDLRWRGEFTLSLYTYDPEEGYFEITVRPHRDHTVGTTYGIMSRGGFSRGHCDGGVATRFRVDRDIVRFAVRRSCVPQIRRHPMIDFEASSYSVSAHESPRAYDDLRQAVYHQ